MMKMALRQWGKKAGELFNVGSARNSSAGHRTAAKGGASICEGICALFLKEIGISDNASCLVVGLGNWNVTPDALGPIVVENTLVTRHLFELQPEQIEEGFRPVSALRPGVMGITGIETSDIIFLELLRK
ncbi:hypothetical protein GCM10020331_038390 [Ectobacillus funiculus]